VPVPESSSQMRPRRPQKLLISNLIEKTVTSDAPVVQGYPSSPLKQTQILKQESQNENRLVSLGSVGHPSLCKPPCKYASKKRGCKDGATCDRCHLCSWKNKAPEGR
jgi:hypothetical protein